MPPYLMSSFGWTASCLSHKSSLIDIPFAFMTGDDIPEGKFDDVPRLLKPFTLAELRDALHRILAV